MTSGHPGWPPDGEKAALLLDVEGTTTPVEFVTQVLFPFARTHLDAFLENFLDRPEVDADAALLVAEHHDDEQRGLEPPAWLDGTGAARRQSLLAYACWLMDRDRKSTGLKSLQGKIWEHGYRSGELHSLVYEDVPVAFRRWQERGYRIAIFSSGSVLAQKLLFRHTGSGDLTSFIDGYFDTTTGPKLEGDSYIHIADLLQTTPGTVLFVSDHAGELDAAASAGMATALCNRSSASPPATGHRVIDTFDAI